MKKLILINILLAFTLTCLSQVEVYYGIGYGRTTKHGYVQNKLGLRNNYVSTQISYSVDRIKIANDFAFNMGYQIWLGGEKSHDAVYKNWIITPMIGAAYSIKTDKHPDNKWIFYPSIEIEKYCNDRWSIYSDISGCSTNTKIHIGIKAKIN